MPSSIILHNASIFLRNIFLHTWVAKREKHEKLAPLYFLTGSWVGGLRWGVSNRKYCKEAHYNCAYNISTPPLQMHSDTTTCSHSDTLMTLFTKCISYCNIKQNSHLQFYCFSSQSQFNLVASRGEVENFNQRLTYGSMISAMRKTWTESRNPGIKKEFAV